MLNSRQFEVVEDKVKIAPSKDAPHNIVETRSPPLSSKIVLGRARHRAKNKGIVLG